MIGKNIFIKYEHILYKWYNDTFGIRIIKNHKHTIPDFIIIGVQKGGTTSLFQYLGQHPEILPPKEKELAYFAWNQSKGLNWYLKKFPKKTEKADRLTFEGTPAYIYLKKAPKLISKLFPDIKFILLLRDPVERAYSHWQFYHESKFVREQQPHLKDNRSFEDAINDELGKEKISWHSRYLDRGKYVQQIRNWYRYFEKDQILILESKTFKEKPKDTLQQVTQFLGISNYYEKYSFEEKGEEGLKKTVDERNGEILRKYNVNKYVNNLDSNTKKKLRDYYRPFDEELEQLLGRKLSWMKN